MASQGTPGGVSRCPSTGYIETDFLKICFVEKCKVTHFWKFSSLAQIYPTGCCFHMCRQNVLFRKLYLCLRGLNFSVSRCSSLSYLFWMTNLSPFLGVPIITFLTITKNDASSRPNIMIAATNAWRGKWNRHAAAPSDNFFTHVPFF